MSERPAHQFRPGQSGNPAGKRPGTRNRATAQVLALMEGGGEEVVRAIIAAAQNGDVSAAKLVLDRICPPLRDRPVRIALPKFEGLAGVSAAQGAVLEAVAAGEITPAEGNTLASVIEARRKALETEVLEQRIAALEERNK